MSYTKEDHLKSRVEKLRKRSKVVLIIVLILISIIVIASVTAAMIDRAQGSGNWTAMFAYTAITIIPLLLWIGTRIQLVRARKKYDKYRVEKTEQLISEEKAQPRPYQKYSSEEKAILIPKADIMIFVSYATVDAPTFKIAEVAEKLAAYPEIKNVLYWQEHMKENIVEYMDRNLGNCHAMLLFCSPNAIESTPVKKEWTAAESMNKPIIPVFTSTRYVPPILSSRLGVQFDPFNMEKNIDDIYNIIMRNTS